MNKDRLRKILVPAGFFLGGTILCLALLEISIRFTAFLYLRNTVEKTAPGVDRNAPVSVACFGDSFTEGGHMGPVERYPSQLQKMFDAAGEKVCVVNYGVCESNSTQIRRRLFKIANSRHIDYAVVMAGSADRHNFIGFNDGSLAFFIKDLRVYHLAQLFGIYLRDHYVRRKAQDYARHNAFEQCLNVPEPTENDIEAMARKDPSGAPMLWARFYMDQSRYPEAIAVLRKELDRGTADPNVRVTVAECYEAMRDFPAAERMYRESVQRSPEMGYLAMGRYYEGRGNVGAAERMYRTAVTYSPADAYAALGQLYRGQRQFDRAKASLKRLAELDKERADLELLDLYAESGQYTEAETKYKELLVNSPQASQNLAQFAIAYYIPRGKYADAVRCFLTALDQKTPPNMHPFFLLTMALRLQSRYTAQDVLQAMDRAAARNPFLADEPAFRAYRTYFRNVSGWDRKMRRWLESDLEKMADFCHRKKITLIVMNYPDSSFKSVNSVITLFALHRRLPFVDLTAQFNRLVIPATKRFYFREDNAHCTDEGNRIIAESVFKTIQTLRGRKVQGGAA